MRLIKISIFLLLLSSCAGLSNLNKNVSVPEGKAVFIVENTSLSRSFFNEFMGGDTVLMQFDKLDGKNVGSFLDEVFHLVVEPGKRTVKVLCGIKGNHDSSNHTILTVDAKANSKYVFQAYLENNECVVKQKEAKKEVVKDESQK
jgi:hypothetical protein